MLVSNCGFWEMDNFDPLLVHMKAVSKNLEVNLQERCCILMGRHSRE